MKLKTVLYLAGKGAGIPDGDITTYMLPLDVDPDPLYYVYPREEEIQEMLTKIYFYGRNPTGRGRRRERSRSKYWHESSGNGRKKSPVQDSF